MPKSVKCKREDNQKEGLEAKITRKMRRKEEDNFDILKTSPTIESSAKSSELKPKKYDQDSKLENAPLAATNVNFKGGKVKKLASIFGKSNYKEVRKDLERVIQAREPSLARNTANGRGSELDSGKKRTWDLSHKVAATPPNVIGCEAKPRRN